MTKEELVLQKVFGTPRKKPCDPSELNENEIDILSSLLEENDEVLKKIVERWEKSRVVELQSILPKKSIISRAKLRKVLSEDVFNTGEFDVTVSGSNSKKTVKISAEIKGIDGQITKGCTPYDLTVLDAVSTLWSVGNEIMTAEMIYRAMNGYTQQERVSPQAVAAVTKSVDKMRMTYTRIDFTNEAQMRKIGSDTLILEGNMILADKIIVSVKGYQKSAYKFYRLPILHEYSQANNYLLRIPVEVVNTKKALQSTSEIIVIRSYLIRRVETIKSKKNKEQWKKVLYSSIFEECEIDINEDRALKKRYTTYIKRLLNYWIEIDYIKGYTEYKKGREIAGIDLDVK